MLMRLANIEEFVSSPIHGDIFVLTRLAGDQWNIVVVPGRIRNNVPTDRGVVIDLTASSDEEAQPALDHDAEDTATEQDAEDADSAQPDSLESADDNAAHVDRSDSNDSDDSSVDYGLSQDFQLMAEIVGDDDA
ncbi:hypothetical protein FisN_UnNu080 [Fistulifera solaris]|uniref:Uncharacterized protein n=1 Tax=Fistulifera solaris TaxID=1519565 RepID=A0A1Z5JSM7_FISSO|nr:hypothetical protein FisN_UnNu080 [Fistulifera solaris]|eukprot:GAX16788.1 hypothetical protein FisN_UnNu080 [Fistulifera solaris]